MDGALIIDKSGGMTSHDAVARARRIIGERRVGHTGTLDPFATGVLVMLVGKATRLMQFLNGAEKEYEAVIRLGYATETGDCTGRPIESESQVQAEGFAREQIESALASLRGEIEQTPPMYSAKKIKGQKLYELARRGEEIEREPVRITIREFEAINREGELLKANEYGTHDLVVRVICSAGTYVRTLAEDFGKQLGVGAHVAELRRTRAGDFRIQEALTLERLAELMQTESIDEAIISPDKTIAHLPVLDLNADDVRRVIVGIDLRVESAVGTARQAVRLRNAAGELIAVGVYDEAQEFVHPQVVLANN